jgi:hypothetical protein
MSTLGRSRRSVARLLARVAGGPAAAAPPRALARSSAVPGSRVVERGFFDDHPRFLASGDGSALPWRLNLRYEAIFGEHRDAFAGARVLDLASHDGRWSLAALRTGAIHVTGIEADAELVAEARANLAEYDAAIDLRAGDVFQVLATDPPQVDVVLCLGFFHHTLRFVELWKRMAQCSPRTVLIDTLVHQGSDEALIRIADEPVSPGDTVADEFSAGDTVVTGRPTVRALKVLARAYGYELAGFSDWSALLRDNPAADGVGDYRAGRRVTVRFDRV